ncbi:MAG: NADH-quinone oxidoreductase subunit C [Thermoplasmata archaeon]|nr:MAG: NADH-quinone oxidoreductase subunit C [Thermoplasmata archaeon]
MQKGVPGAFSELEQKKPGVIYGKLYSPKYLLNVCKFLKNRLNFKYPLSISALDWPEHYELVYHIVSYENNNLFELHLPVPKDKPEVSSVVRVWKGANPHEREAYDMMGITFKTHPDPRRILLPENVDYFPLRKDFPLGGDKEGKLNSKSKGSM